MENQNTIESLKNVYLNLDNLINKLSSIDIKDQTHNPEINHIVKNLKNSLDTALLQVNFWEYECDKQVAIPFLSEEELTLHENTESQDENQSHPEDEYQSELNCDDLEELDMEVPPDPLPPSTDSVEATPMDIKNLLSMMMIMNMASDPNSILRNPSFASHPSANIQNIEDILDDVDDISQQMDNRNAEHQKYEAMVNELVDDLD